MHEVSFIDKTFNRDSAQKYSISIQANSRGLAYCVADDEMDTYVLFRKHRFEKVILAGDLLREISNTLKHDEYLNLKYHRVRYLGFTQQTTLVPEKYFDGSQMHAYLNYNTGGDVDHELFNNKILPPGIHNVFALPAELVKIITLHFKKAEFYNQSTPFIRTLCANGECLDRRVAYVGLNPDFFDIACTENGKLLLYNTFLYASENDLLYYILFVLNTVGFNVADTLLFLTGEHSSKLTYFEMLRQYLPKINYLEPACIPTITPGLKNLNIPQFINLLNLKSCALSVGNTEAGK